MAVSFSMFPSYRAAVDWCCLLLILTVLGTAAAQDATTHVLSNLVNVGAPQQGEGAPAQANGAPQMGEAVTPDSGSIATWNAAQAVSPDVRRLHYTLKLDVRGTYDDNVTLTSQGPISDYYVRIDPRLGFGFGDVQASGPNFLSFEYDPDIVLFFDHSEFNTLQHVIHLAAQSNLSRLTLGVSEDAQFLKGADVNQFTKTNTFVNAVNLDVRGRPRVNTFSTRVNAGYDLASKTSISAIGQSSITDYSQFSSTQTISGSLFLDYAYGPKLTFGVGGTGGREFVDQPNPDQTFEQANARLSYVLTGKLSASASGGVEFRQFDTGRNAYVSPVFGLDLFYEPFDGSSFSLSGSRYITASASLAGQDFTSTQITASGRQRLFQRVFVSLTLGYENLTYFNTITAANVSSTRDDNYYFIEPGIDVNITRFWNAGGYYLHRQNDSSLSNFGFDESQAGVRTTFVF